MNGALLFRAVTLAANRTLYPTVTRIADDFRKVFGPGVKLVHGVEPDGREVGKKPDYLKEATQC